MPSGGLFYGSEGTMGEVIFGYDFHRAKDTTERVKWLGPESLVKIAAILAEIRAEQAKARLPADDGA